MLHMSLGFPPFIIGEIGKNYSLLGLGYLYITNDFVFSNLLTDFWFFMISHPKRGVQFKYTHLYLQDMLVSHISLNFCGSFLRENR